jgi:hypothetical protein
VICVAAGIACVGFARWVSLSPNGLDFLGVILIGVGFANLSRRSTRKRGRK